MVFQDTSYPWSTVGLAETDRGSSSGVVIGPRHLLTVSHVIDWNAPAGFAADRVRFTPSYFDGDAPFGVTYGIHNYWYLQEDGDGFITGDEGLFDYVVVVLDDRIGERTGWMGARGYDDDWDDLDVWSHGYWEEGLTCLLRVLPPAAALPLAAERSRTFNSCGNFACQLARYDAALRHYEQSLAIRRSLEDERGTAATLNNLGLVHSHQEDYEQARPLFEEALQLFRKLGQEHAVATCLNNLASVHTARGDYCAADQNAREALQLFGSLGDRLGVAASLAELGNLAVFQGQADRAQSFFQRESRIIAGTWGEGRHCRLSSEFGTTYGHAT